MGVHGRSSIVLAALLLSGPAAGATLEPETALAWDRYVAATQGRIERELRSASGFLAQDFTPDRGAAWVTVLAGQVVVAEMTSNIPVRGGLIHHWRGSIFVPGVTLEGLLGRLQNPSETGPHQEDVLALRVLDRRRDALRLFIRMTRKKIVTVTYNTEHDVTYRRHTPARASSGSVSTKIAEVADAGTRSEREMPQGDDHGFLWRMNSYWRYQEVDGGVSGVPGVPGVIVELESLTLSRTVPLGLGPIVAPIIKRIARESVGRTLDTLRRNNTGAESSRP